LLIENKWHYKTKSSNQLSVIKTTRIRFIEHLKYKSIKRRNRKMYACILITIETYLYISIYIIVAWVALKHVFQIFKKVKLLMCY